MAGYKISDIADTLSARAVGATDIVVRGVSEPKNAASDQLAVAMDAKFADDLGKGLARAAILWQEADWQSLGLEAAILVDRPRVAMAALTGFLDDTVSPDQGIHPSALIDPLAKIGEEATIGPFVVISANVEIGSKAKIGAHCTIGPGVEIGDDCQLQPGVNIGQRVKIGDRFVAHSGVVIGADGFSFVTAEKSSVEKVRETLSGGGADQTDQNWLKIASIGGVLIGDDVEVGANSSIDAGTIRPTSIGDGTKIDALVQVGHNVKVGQNCLLCAHVAVGGSATLGNGVVLGGQAGVADNISIGDGVIAGGASKILSNVPSGRAILGYPAVKMETHVESYKALRRLPRLMQGLSQSKKSVPKTTGND